MATVEKDGKKDKKKQKAPKSQENRIKTREVISQKPEPPRAAQMMQAYGKQKLTAEFRQRRADQRTELNRPSEQAQAADTFLEEAEIIADIAVEESVDLLKRDFQYLTEWQHAESPPPLPPLFETPPAPEPDYPVTPPKSASSRRMPVRQISRLPATASIPNTEKISNTRKTQKPQPARSNRIGRAVLSERNPAFQLMQERGKLLFRRKTIQKQQVRLQQRSKSSYFRSEAKTETEIYPITERKSPVPTPIHKPIPLTASVQDHIPVPANRTVNYPISPQKHAPSLRMRQKLIAEKRQTLRRYTVKGVSFQPVSAYPIEDLPSYESVGTELAGRLPDTSTQFPETIGRPLDAHERLSKSFDSRSQTLVTAKTRLPSAAERRRMVMEKRTGARQHNAVKPLTYREPTYPIAEERIRTKYEPFSMVTAEQRAKMVLEKRQKPRETASLEQFMPSEPQPSDRLPVAAAEAPFHQKTKEQLMCATSQKKPYVLSAEQRRKLVAAKRKARLRLQESSTWEIGTQEIPNLPMSRKTVSPEKPGKISVIPPDSTSRRNVSSFTTYSVIESPNLHSGLLKKSGSNGAGTKRELASKYSTMQKAVRARDKLLQSKRLPKQAAKRLGETEKAAYQRAYYIGKIRDNGKNVQRGVSAIMNVLKKLVRTGVSFAKSAGSGAFACIILLALVLMVGMAGALAGSPFGVLFSPQETSPEAKSVGAAVAEANNEYFGKVTDIINNTEHDELVIHRVPSDGAADTRLRTWEEILAVFAVKTTTDPTNATDVVMIDDDRTDRLKEVLWDMVSVSKRVETTGRGEDETKTLHLTITVKTPDEAALDYHFNQVQTGALTEMLLPENKALLTELIGWATGTGGVGSIGGVGNINGYEVPPEALSDERFAAMLNEAKKYLGMPYVWGGSSPSTSFDCSGFVCWVLNKSGAMSIERTTATGIYNRCTVIPRSEAKPGDLIFFTRTYNSPGPISHIGIYVGDGMMIHAGDPIQFTSVESNYWLSHFYAISRIP